LDRHRPDRGCLEYSEEHAAGAGAASARVAADGHATTGTISAAVRGGAALHGERVCHAAGRRASAAATGTGSAGSARARVIFLRAGRSGWNQPDSWYVRRRRDPCPRYCCRRGLGAAKSISGANDLESTSQRTVDLSDLEDRVRLFGQFDQNLSALENGLRVSVRADGDRLTLAGSAVNVERAEHAVRRMLDAAVDGAQITPDDVALAISDAGQQANGRALPGTLIRAQRGKEIRPKTAGQRAFVQSIENNTLTVGIGPAGTGKTFLAVVMAVRALKNHEVSRLILSRPAVEAGEKLGFLPGDLREKVDPYLRPLYDALEDLLDDGVVERYLERGTIEVAPLAYMRGRTLNDAFVILDEAQNATADQLKMFLTRLGAGSKMVINGDVTQIDLPSGGRSGLRDAARRIGIIDDVGVVELDETDVVRHPLVARIIKAYANPLPE
jgi:phosphate starvation-inducible protein PhoH and related proteins